MASILNADNGVVSGSAGLKSNADSSGVLELQTNGTTAVTVNTNQSVSLTAGTANGVTYLNGSKVLTSGSALTFDGTTLGSTGGVKVTGNAASLAIDGGTLDYASNNTRLAAGRAGGNYSQFDLYVAGASGITKRFSSFYNTVFAWYGENGTSELMRLDSTGLGIGTSSPWTKLSVYGSGSQRIAVTSPTGGATVAALDLSPSLTAGEAASYDPQARIYAVDDNYSANIIFANKATGATANSLQTRMTLNTSGNLGLGVTPSAWDTGIALKAFQFSATLFICKRVAPPAVSSAI